MNSLKIGDFVTSYTAGYWQLIDIKPKVADEDYTSETISYKKGDVISHWAILKKCFTPKMKPRIEFEFVDACWVKRVPEDIAAEIDAYFLAHPDYKQKFDTTEPKLRPALINYWVNIPSEKVPTFYESLKNLPRVSPQAIFGMPPRNLSNAFQSRLPIISCISSHTRGMWMKTQTCCALTGSWWKCRTPKSILSHASCYNESTIPINKLSVRDKYWCV